MDVLQSMKNQMIPTKLYRLDGTTTVDFELAAYAEGLKAIRDEILTLQAESFLATASGYGLQKRENAFAFLPPGNLEAQRQGLLRLGSVRPGSCTKAGLELIYSVFGISVSLEEDVPNLKIIAHFLSEPDCGEAGAKKVLEIFCPAHLTIEPDFSAVS